MSVNGKKAFSAADRDRAANWRLRHEELCGRRSAALTRLQTSVVAARAQIDPGSPSHSGGMSDQAESLLMRLGGDLKWANKSQSVDLAIFMAPDDRPSEAVENLLGDLETHAANVESAVLAQVEQLDEFNRVWGRLASLRSDMDHEFAKGMAQLVSCAPRTADRLIDAYVVNKTTACAARAMLANSLEGRRRIRRDSGLLAESSGAECDASIGSSHRDLNAAHQALEPFRPHLSTD